MNKQRYSFLQVTLTVLCTACYLISNIITSRQVQFFFGLTLTGGVFVFPITYILSDVFSEVYGYRWSRITCYFSFAMNILMVGIFQCVINAPAPDYFTNGAAFETVLGSVPRVFAASMLAFLAGDFVNDVIFKKMKDHHQNELKGFGLRAVLSSFVGEIADSTVFYPIAFYGQMPIATLLQVMAVEVLIKTSYEVIILPLTTFVAKKVTTYEKG